jgi:hypothetical protein
MNLGNAPVPDPSSWGKRTVRWASVTIDTNSAASSTTPAMPPLFASQIHQLADDRKQLIFRIRRQIAENRYDTPDKFDIALDRMLDDLGPQGR